ncbi:MAG: hypothetical protein PHD82_17170 [Candidatus Riflebacteria bacterium]|jgi:hypothetical protein|nr:hypothetical protein [Candidatus Riflebacteria bacterium]
MKNWINKFRKELSIIMAVLSGLALIWLIFPPDIHNRLRAIRKMQPGAYHPSSTMLENIKERANLIFERMNSSDKPGSEPHSQIPAPLDDVKNKFDIERYFDYFNRLKMAEGYSLDYAYYLDFGSGFPLLYARPARKPKLEDHYEFQEEYGQLNEPGTVAKAYIDHIRTDGSREGFIQLAALLLVGEQFYLYWHAHYKDTQILSRLPSWVSFSADQVAVTLFTFTKWGGLYLHTVKFKRLYPHSLISESSTRLLPYNCGIRF